MNIKRAEKQLKEIRSKIESKEADVFVENVRLMLMKQGADRFARRIEDAKHTKAVTQKN